jgi:nucleotide-binding universal stress UspA family protein
MDATEETSASSRAATIKTIVVPLDGSAESEVVLPHVRAIATATGGKLILFSSVYVPSTWMEAAAQLDMSKEIEAARNYLESRQAGLAAIPSEVDIGEGPPARAILECARSSGADLIAMTTHGHSGVSRLAWGSVAEKVLHSTEKPLLVVRPPEGGGPSIPAPQIKKILVPLDGSQLSQAALPFAQALAQALGSSLLLLHSVATPWAGKPGTFVPTVHDRTLRESIDAGKHLLDRLAADIERASGLTAARTVTLGDPVHQIVRLAETESIGLIVMSTHGHSGVGRWLIGSVADAVVRRTHLPCLLVRPREASNR